MDDLFINSQRSVHTRRNYTYDLNKWWEFLGDREPSEMLAVEFRNYLEDTLAPASARRVFNTCRAYYRYAKEQNVFEFIKSTKAVKNRVPKVPSDRAVAGLLASCGNARDRAVISLALNGLRSAEIINLAPEDFVWVHAYGCYIINVLGKGNKARRVPATIETVEAVTRYQKSIIEPSAWLLTTPEGKQMTTRQVQYTTEKYSDNLIRPHALRHHYATRLIRSGAGVFAVKELMGHEDIQTTQIYVSLDMQDIINEASKDPRNQHEDENIIPLRKVS